jgi:hypothetical protein
MGNIMMTNFETLAGHPPAEQAVLRSFGTLQDTEIARVKASLYPAILAAIQRRDRLYPEGVWPEQMVRDFCKELALVQEYGLSSISLEEYAVREAAADEKQDGFQVWRDADDEVIRTMSRDQLASIIAGKVAEFLVKAEVSDFHLHELIEPDPRPTRPANGQGGRPHVEFENKHAA